LAIGAKTPAEIAVSIAAELIAGIRGGSLGHAVPLQDSPREAVDPVCGMTVSIGPATEHLRLAGVDYWFCGPGCRTAFAAGKAGV
jgi:xanthine dehydrogenase accessory factor